MTYSSVCKLRICSAVIYANDGLLDPHVCRCSGSRALYIESYNGVTYDLSSYFDARVLQIIFDLKRGHN